MFEICEAEALARRLAGELTGQIIQSYRPASWFAATRSLEGLVGWRVTDVKRVGKAIVWCFDNPGAGSRFLAVRLGMSGTWHLGAFDKRRLPRAWAFSFEMGAPGHTPITCAYLDKRRSSAFEVGERLELLKSLASYGPDLLGPIGIDWVAFCLSRHRIPVKALLLRPEYFAGVGRSVADEALFRANLGPSKISAFLSAEEASRLMVALQVAVRAGVRALERGEAPVRQVFGREGQPCYMCDNKVIKCKINNIPTYFCPSCQADDWKPAPEVGEDYVRQIAGTFA